MCTSATDYTSVFTCSFRKKGIFSTCLFVCKIRYCPIRFYDVSKYTTHTEKYTIRSYLPVTRVLSDNSSSPLTLGDSPQHSPQNTVTLKQIIDIHTDGNDTLSNRAWFPNDFPTAQCLVKAPVVNSPLMQLTIPSWPDEYI